MNDNAHLSQRIQPNRSRSARGQLVGAPDVLILVLFAVPILLLIINVGIVLLYKQKLAIATNIAARVVSTVPGAVSSDGLEAARAACVQMKIASTLGAVSVSTPVLVTVDGQPAVALGLALDVPLMGSAFHIFPTTFHISDTSVALIRNYVGDLGVSCALGGTSVAGLPSGLGAPIIHIPFEHADVGTQWPQNGYWQMQNRQAFSYGPPGPGQPPACGHYPMTYGEGATAISTKYRRPTTPPNCVPSYDNPPGGW